MKSLRELMEGRVEKTRFWFIEGVSFTSEELARSREPLEVDDHLMTDELVERLKIAIRSGLFDTCGYNFNTLPAKEDAQVTVKEETLDLGDGDTRTAFCIELDGGLLNGFGWLLLLPDTTKMKEWFTSRVSDWCRDVVDEFHDIMLPFQWFDGEPTVWPFHKLQRCLEQDICHRTSVVEEVASQYKCFIDALHSAVDVPARDILAAQLVIAPDKKVLLSSCIKDVSELVMFEDLMKDKLIEWQMEQDLSKGLPQ